MDLTVRRSKDRKKRAPARRWAGGQLVSPSLLQDITCGGWQLSTQTLRRRMGLGLSEEWYRPLS
ncbi:hypothetical protein MPNT_20160 [Candidatus Methylacidithermus pantelleriae]|uniref:Uncharacterized protein n=1 Tax=Candidatus Methylacidithermus pantelleriae TaxID=2744239 RepID=A0A8J2BPF8_9BACT|nr:hypothetical protein MPNT_20160 [Candidatus Methylacidithermus pantelleriae]